MGIKAKKRRAASNVIIEAAMQIALEHAAAALAAKQSTNPVDNVETQVEGIGGAY
jgi:hypothetical protein